jgi:hypothetical protein
MRRESILLKFIKDRGFEYGAELGVWRGRVFKHLLTSHPTLKLVGVDLYASQPDNDGPEKWIPGENGHMWAHDVYYGDMVKFCETVNGRGRIIRDYTHNAVKEFQDGELDFVFIDADHSYKGVKTDIEDWGPKVREGGIIFGHDINWPTVRQAVEEAFGDDYSKERDNVWYHEKKMKKIEKS